MNTSKYTQYWAPTHQQELLLRAALLKGQGAIEAWKEWKSSVDIEALDSASHRMLPLLYRNLQTHGIEDPSMAKYKGVYRQTWYKNQMLFHGIASLLLSFHNAGIRTMVLKGAALTMLHYRDYGLRPMNDFDVLVYQDQALSAVNLLQGLGWTPMDFTPTGKYISASYSHGFKNNNGQEFDLHWHLLSQCREVNSDKDFWEGAAETKFHDVPTSVLNATDQLLHTCIHGARWNYTPSFRWVADAAVILNTSQSEIEWDRLVAQARNRRLVLPLREALHYLRTIVNAPVPLEIIERIRDLPVPKAEQFEYMVNISPPTRWTAMLDLWCQHSRLAGDSMLLNKLVAFPRFLKYIWGRSLWKIPLYGLFKMVNWHKNPLAKRL
jgi:hypothetical protein